MKSKRSTTDEAPLRADAARNRQRILEAADALFLERGAEASLDDIAKRANVGIGTLYRRFPTRDALLAATSDERLLSLAEASRARDDKLEPNASVRLRQGAREPRDPLSRVGCVAGNGTAGRYRWLSRRA
ncbi:TetR/AcrR family transcriptional regulator [Paraburkholderia sp. EG304]|uniref:TetR/AcrR family transcriptional regulator n=1 Tax=Paraburkholderia sp. EG304 TaxID=3237015 RepID=UPI00397A2A28